MRLRVRSVAVALAAALCGLAGTAQAQGLLIVQKTTSGGSTDTNQIQIESQRMRAESTNGSGGKHVIMFDGTRQVMTLVDPAKKTYIEMTKDDVEKLAAEMSGAMARMQKQMAYLPPEQRAQFDAMMKGRGMGAGTAAAAPKVEYRKAGTDTVGKWTCAKYEGFEGGQKTAEVCTVDPKVLGFAASDFEVSKQLAALFKKMMPQGADQVLTIGSTEEQGYSGIPVRQSFTTGGKQITTEITDVSRQTFPAAIFQVPAGYAKTAFVSGRGGGRH